MADLVFITHFKSNREIKEFSCVAKTAKFDHCTKDSVT